MHTEHLHNCSFNESSREQSFHTGNKSVGRLSKGFK